MNRPEDATALVKEGWQHLRFHRPLAAWASWNRALRLVPELPQARQAIALLEGSEELPPAARVPYKLRSPTEDRRVTWDRLLRGRDASAIEVALEVFESLAATDPGDASAQFNAALCLAWLGRNSEAVRRLDDVVALEASGSPASAVEAWMLAEVLRHGGGAEALADDLNFSVKIPWPADAGDAAAVFGRESVWKPVKLRAEATPGLPAMEGAALYEWLDRPMPTSDAVRSAEDLPRVVAGVLHRESSVCFSSPDPYALHEVALPAIEAALPHGAPDPEVRRSLLAPAMLDAAAWTFRLPADAEVDDRRRWTREAIERWYEYEWITRPRLGLSRHEGRPPVSPVEASARASEGDAISRVKLAAVVDLREQLAERRSMRAMYDGYPFDRVRSRLGLPLRDPETVDPEEIATMPLSALRRVVPANRGRDELIELHDSAAAFGDDAIREAAALEWRSRSQDSDSED